MERAERIQDDDIDLALIRETPFPFSMNNLILPLRKVDGCLLAAVAEERGGVRRCRTRQEIRPEAAYPES